MVDKESRKSELQADWKLNEISFIDILDHFGFFNTEADEELKKNKKYTRSIFSFPSADLFASRVSKQPKRFFSYRPDAEAEVINAFCVLWYNLKFCCFLPFLCIGKVLRKICANKSEGILVCQIGQIKFGTPNYMICSNLHLSFHLVETNYNYQINLT